MKFGLIKTDYPDLVQKISKHTFAVYPGVCTIEKGQRPEIFVAKDVRFWLEVQRTAIYFGALHLQPIYRVGIYKYFTALRLILTEELFPVQYADSHLIKNPGNLRRPGRRSKVPNL